MTSQNETVPIRTKRSDTAPINVRLEDLVFEPEPLRIEDYSEEPTLVGDLVVNEDFDSAVFQMAWAMADRIRMLREASDA